MSAMFRPTSRRPTPPRLNYSGVGAVSEQKLHDSGMSPIGSFVERRARRLATRSYQHIACRSVL